MSRGIRNCGSLGGFRIGAKRFQTVQGFQTGAKRFQIVAREITNQDRDFKLG